MHRGVAPRSGAAGSARGSYGVAGRTGPTAAPPPSAASSPAGCSAAQTRSSWPDREKTAPAAAAWNLVALQRLGEVCGTSLKEREGGSGPGVGGDWTLSWVGGRTRAELGIASEARPGRTEWSAPGPTGGGEGSPGCAPRARQRGFLQPYRILGISTGVCLLFKGSITVRSASASAFKPTPSSEPSAAGDGLVAGIAHHLEEGLGVSVCGS